MYLIAKKTGEVVVLSGKYGAGEPSKEVAIRLAVDQSGIAESDLLFFHIDDDDEVSERLFDGWSYTVVITGGAVVGIDFGLELIKPKLFFAMDKHDAIDDGTDCITVTCTAKKEDGSTDSSVTGSIKIPVRATTGSSVDKAFVFAAGVGVSKFKGSVAGEFVVPRAVDRFGVFRVGNTVRPNIVME